jgi:hypothetical protein
MARLTVWTPSAERRLLECLRRGHFIETACAIAGIGEQTLRDRLKRGRQKGSGPDHAFLLAAQQASAEAEARDLAIVEKAAAGYEVVRTRQVISHGQVVELTERRFEFSWQAAAWRLERRSRRRWESPLPEEPSAEGEGSSVTIYLPDNEREPPPGGADAAPPLKALPGGAPASEA